MRKGYSRIDDGSIGGNQKRDWSLKRCPTPIRIAAVLAVVIVVACGLIIPIAVLFSGTTTLPNAMTQERMKVHLTRLFEVAQAHGGSRAPWTGYNASVDYVENELKKNTNFKVTRQTFEMSAYEQTGPAHLNLTKPAHSFVYGYDYDFEQSLNSGAGTVTEAVVSYLGLACNASAIKPLGANTVALIQRGDCNFEDKVANAIAKKAVAVIIFNNEQGDKVAYFDASSKGPVAVPVFGTTYEAGVLIKMADSEVSLKTGSFSSSKVTTQNLCAESPGGAADSVIMVGAHLDSVAAGAGINDNGSGSAMVLELAIAASNVFRNPVNKLRFCWWGAEEEGLLGSVHYVDHLTAKEKGNIQAYLNFDMVGSRNYISFTFDGKTAPSGVRNASTTLTSLFVSEFGKIAQPFRLEAYADDLDAANTDYGPFLFAGIPTGGLSTGAAEIKTMEERSDFGGFANTAADSCYHQACDNLENIEYDEMLQNAKLAASVLEILIPKPDLQDFLDSSPPQYARDAPADRRVCVSSHVENELVCMPSKSRIGPRRPKM